MRKRCFCGLMLAAALMALPTNAFAADYTFKTDAAPDYYDATSYEEVYGSRYNYGGVNLIDYQTPELEYGCLSTTQTGIMEQTHLPGLSVGGSGYGISSTGDISVVLPGSTNPSSGVLLPELANMTRFTALTDDFLLSNGAIGRLSIPDIGVKNYYIWEDTTASSMNRGVGHFTSTSVWDGNVGIAGHNRGATYVIGKIKDLDVGDKITYKTSAGQRTYAVETIAAIANDDWSYLEATSDNRITLITCVAGDSSRRWCVQAVEVS